MLVRFIALAIIAWVVVDLALYWVVCHHNEKPMEALPILFKSLPLLAGLVMLIKAKALAEWISNLLDN